MLKEVADYYNDNPQGYWFKARLYGWGWMPVKWQGWAVVIIYIVAVSSFSFTIDENSPPEEIAFTFFMPLVFMTATLIRICYWKGEKPRWQWGPPKKK